MCRSPKACMLAALITSCANEARRLPDAMPTRDASVDAGAEDAGVGDSETPTDSGVSYDSGPSDVPTPDRGFADADLPDVTIDGGASNHVAVVDVRCEPSRRLGVVEISDSFGARYLNAAVTDAPDPMLGPPALSTEDCRFHDAVECGCTQTGYCDYLGECARAPAPVSGLVVRVIGGASEQRFEADSNGLASGQIMLPDQALSLELTGPDLLVTTSALEVPRELADVSGTLRGTYDAPVSVDVRWTPVAGARVTTLIRINHHVPRATFTECVVDSTDGLLHIDEPMLTPLAVATGLEFQGIWHTRFAAAELPNGCLELRFTRQHYVSLF
ncbi:MAG: hypothetical protein HY791_07440 [Deltaproteobacteria bacterium]|nr:hypothetical protein [Deltaproteobacteria bacterium]